MFDAHCTTWKALFQTLPDPRHRRGCRYPWWVMLTLIMTAVASGQRHPQAIIQWTSEHADLLREQVWPRVPSGSTLRRVLRYVAIAELEAQVSAWTAQRAPRPSSGLQARALDGKTLRGAGRHGQPTHLVAEVVHGSGLVLWQQAVAAKSNEIPLARRILADRDLTGLLYTLDALHTQLETAELIVRQRGHYLMIVKGNQRHLHRILQEWFEDPAWPEEQGAISHTCDVGHGRHEHRTLERRRTLHLPVPWPGVQQALRRVTQSWQLQTGTYRTQVAYALTSLPCDLAPAADLEAYWRGHWTIENKVHYVRDGAFQEDACQVAKGQAPQALAALRNGVLNQLRLSGIPNIAAALRHLGAHPEVALRFVGVGL
jgi:predicted transposase YbfD/YdcC